MNSLSEQEIEDIAARIFEKMKPLFESIGLDISTLETRRAIYEDHSWLRDWRKGSAKARSTISSVGIATFLGGALWLLWFGIVEFLKRPFHQ